MKVSFTLVAAGFSAMTAVAAPPTLDVILTPEGKLCQRVSFEGEEVIPPSALGIVLDGIPLGTKETITGKLTVGDLTTYGLRHANGTEWMVETRTFPDGVAFRYRIPTEGEREVSKELTSFTFPSGTTAWYASAVFQYGYTQKYQERPTDTIKGQILAPPATFRLPSGHYAALTEANLWDYYGCVFEGTAPNVVSVRFCENAEALKEGKILGMPTRNHNEIAKEPPVWMAPPKRGTREIVTPWRVLMLAKDLNGLVNNKIIEKVSDLPDATLFPKGAKEPWLRPARALWTWLAARPNRLSLDTFYALADEAHQLGYEAIVLDEGWERWPQWEKGKDNPRSKGKDKWGMLKSLCDYARERGVDVWVWRPCVPRRPGDWHTLSNAELETYFAKGNYLEANARQGIEAREDFFAKCAAVGVKGLKLDFLHRENVPTIRVQEKMLRDAAKYRLMVLFHGVNKLTGDNFTFPNLLSKEAVSGLENCGWADNGAMAPWPVHNTTLPFTRWLCGPADYTPVNFRRCCSNSVTFGNQAAGFVMFTSPVLILAADSEDLLNSPCRKLFEAVPVTWDEIRVLEPSAIGRLALVARRKGNDWWLAVMNGLEAKDVSVKLDFLGAGEYTLTAAEDALPERRKLRSREATVTANDTLELKLLSGGGALYRFSPNQQ